MKDLSRSVTMHCPLCGNDQFEALDQKLDDLKDAPGKTRIRCSDCGTVYTKGELLQENTEAIDIAVSEMKDEAIKEMGKELKKALSGKWTIKL